MGQRLLTTCDLCHAEASKEDLSFISIKKEGKPANKFEICSSCLEKVQTQIASNKPLVKNWGFASQKAILVEKGLQDARDGKFVESPKLEDPPDENDNILERHKNRERYLAGDQEYTQEKVISGGPETVKPEGDTCPHYNRSPIIAKVIDGEKTFLQNCRDCGVAIKPAKRQHKRR